MIARLLGIALGRLVSWLGDVRFHAIREWERQERGALDDDR